MHDSYGWYGSKDPTQSLSYKGLRKCGPVCSSLGLLLLLLLHLKSESHTGISFILRYTVRSTAAQTKTAQISEFLPSDKEQCIDNGFMCKEWLTLILKTYSWLFDFLSKKCPRSLFRLADFWLFPAAFSDRLKMSRLCLCLFLVICVTDFRCVRGQELTPQLFNLAGNRRVSATATCGEGVQEPELYCYLVGSNKPGNEVADEDDEKRLLIQGQVRRAHITSSI